MMSGSTSVVEQSRLPRFVRVGSIPRRRGNPRQTARGTVRHGSIPAQAVVLEADFDYPRISGLSNELKEKLCARQPATIAQAARVPGVTPAALSLLLVHAKHAEGERRRA